MYVAAAAAAASQQPFAVVKNICQKYLYPYRTHTHTDTLVVHSRSASRRQIVSKVIWVHFWDLPLPHPPKRILRFGAAQRHIKLKCSSWCMGEYHLVAPKSVSCKCQRWFSF